MCAPHSCTLTDRRPAPVATKHSFPSWVTISDAAANEAAPSRPMPTARRLQDDNVTEDGNVTDVTTVTGDLPPDITTITATPKNVRYEVQYDQMDYFGHQEACQAKGGKLAEPYTYVSARKGRGHHHGIALSEG